MTLKTKISELNLSAKKLAGKFKKLGIETLEDLIFYYPFRYEDYGHLSNIADLPVGQEAAVIGKIELIANRRSLRQRKFLTEAVLTDSTGSIKIMWFNQPWISKSLKPGDVLRVYGKVAGDDFNLYFNSPNYERAISGSGKAPGILPVYPSTAGVTSKQISYLVKLALTQIGKIEDFLPAGIVAGNNLSELDLAVREIHFPNSTDSLKKARGRLAFDELFLLQLQSLLLRQELKSLKAPAVDFNETGVKNFVNSLSFDLTGQQKKSAWEIIRDMQKSEPMNRLLEGDVGSGKTVVALIAMYNAALNGWQSVMMAPTEILANQHYKNILKLLGGSPFSIGLSTRTQKIINGQEVGKVDWLEKCQLGEINIIVGTHALIQDGVNFSKLALAVVDEQHRFGVKQRQALKEKAETIPHFLALSATPIPRTMALIVYGDLDLSLIKEMPADRKKIITKVVEHHHREAAYEFIKKQIEAGRQIFVVCPLIDPSDKLGVRSVTEEFKRLDQEIFPHLAVGLLHGRLKPAEKEEMMQKFVNNEIKILVATAVVEVGVDVPNATVMMIEGAERFGLAQLHQFRGRVGRAEYQSYCFLFSDKFDSPAVERLNFLASCSDGFKLAEYDLQLRGAGSVYGTEQSGLVNSLKMADLNDIEMIKTAKEAANRFIESFSLAKFPNLFQKIKEKAVVHSLE